MSLLLLLPCVALGASPIPRDIQRPLTVAWTGLAVQTAGTAITYGVERARYERRLEHDPSGTIPEGGAMTVGLASLVPFTLGASLHLVATPLATARLRRYGSPGAQVWAPSFVTLGGLAAVGTAVAVAPRAEVAGLALGAAGGAAMLGGQITQLVVTRRAARGLAVAANDPTRVMMDSVHVRVLEEGLSVGLSLRF